MRRLRGGCKLVLGLACVFGDWGVSRRLRVAPALDVTKLEGEDPNGDDLILLC